jgi:uroporphyrinogen-III synthase
MRPRLAGQRIALFEARLSEELAGLVRRSGGEPVCVPAVCERRRPAGPAVAALVGAVAREASPVFIFSTGVGAAALFAEARAQGIFDELRAAIVRGTPVCRGPKPTVALHREGLVAAVRSASPYTTAELLEALERVPLADRAAVVVHHGERNEPLVERLATRGARVHELLLYEWALPEDPAPLAGAVDELVQGRFAAAAFTTQIQARHLFQIAESAGRRHELRAALRERVVVAAVGPTCARVLEELGAPAHVVPENPKMAPMLEALVQRLAAGAPA